MTTTILALALFAPCNDSDARAALALAASRPAQAPQPPQAPVARPASCPAGHPDCGCGCLTTGICTCGTPKADAQGWTWWKREIDPDGRSWDFYVKYAKPAPTLQPVFLPQRAFVPMGDFGAACSGGG